MYQNRQSPSPNKITGPCFGCKKPGHWVKDCPNNSNSRSPSARPVNSDQHFPATHCPCGAGLCVIRTSGSVKNPDRNYYNCPGEKYMDCEYFKWCDKLKREEIREVQPGKYPICTCEAGVCSIQKERNGVNDGRRYFACRVEKGQGACNFKQWLDCSPDTIWISYENPDASLWDEELSPEAEMEIDAIETLSREIPSEEEKTEAHPYPVENSVFENLDHFGETLNSRMHTSPVGNMQASVTTAPRECSPLYAHKGSGILVNPLSGDPSEGSLMTCALQLRNILITSLEAMSPYNHETVTTDADRIFGALNCLEVDYSLFQQRVNEYIKHAADLAHIEKIINENPSYQELVDHRDKEQQRFEELVKSHREAKATFIDSNNLLSAKASSLDGSAESDTEWKLCEAETSRSRETLLQITKTMAECEESLQAASQAVKMSENREVERKTAQDVFQMAKAQLRN